TGSFLGFRGTAQDVSELKWRQEALLRAKEQAELANRTKSEFLASMSHELRTPLNAVIGFSEVMMMESFGPIGNAKYAEYIEDINSSGNHLLGLINDILDLSKVEAGKTELQEETFDPVEVLLSCFNMVKGQARVNGLELVTDIPEPTAHLHADQRAFKRVPWGKAMIWIFLLSDTFIFTCFLLSYMMVRMSTTVPWPNPSEIFALSFGGEPIPLILIAIMTFILISSSGTMAMAVMFGYRQDRVKSAILMLVTAAFGATFVGMQVFEWTKLIVDEGVRPWSNPMGAAQFGATFFMITGFHGLHVSVGVIYLIVTGLRVRSGYYDRTRGNYEMVEITGLYWHFVDLVWVFIFAFFYLW
ncbi:MAG: cytochrome c oxidase subunit 3, partial [Chloroflexi bacterium]|nr:cytochrome c oxidase subunit 3 [Chloroflexota bacterium]